MVGAKPCRNSGNKGVFEIRRICVRGDDDAESQIPGGLEEGRLLLEDEWGRSWDGTKEDLVPDVCFRGKGGLVIGRKWNQFEFHLEESRVFVAWDGVMDWRFLGLNGLCEGLDGDFG